MRPRRRKTDNKMERRKGRKGGSRARALGSAAHGHGRRSAAHGITARRLTATGSRKATEGRQRKAKEGRQRKGRRRSHINSQVSDGPSNSACGPSSNRSPDGPNRAAARPPVFEPNSVHSRAYGPTAAAAAQQRRQRQARRRQRRSPTRGGGATGGPCGPRSRPKRRSGPRARPPPPKKGLRP